ELYKDDGTAPVYTDAALGADAVSKDLLETIRSSGAGKYYVTVTAIASDTDNASKANVADSAAGKSGYKYAAAVSIDYAADTVSQKGKSSISIKDSSAASYVVVAGEQSIPLAATLKNETGYSVSSWTADNASLTFSNQTQSGTSVNAYANMSYSLSSSAVKITLTLKATAATLSASASADKMSVDFGYQAADAPVLTAAASAVSDNVTSDKYDYTYQWYLKEGPMGKWTNVSGAESPQYTMPTGCKAAQGYYMYRCEITATRKDNGEKKTGFTNMLALSVNRIEFKDATVTMGDWEYGQARKSPSTTIQPDGIVPVITYSGDGGTTWSGTIPKDVGNYKVRADYAESINYKEKIVEDTFAITAAKLAAPADLKTEASATAPYGQASWSAVTGPKENSGINSDSSINVKYEVSLFRDTEKLTTITTDGTSYDFTSYYTQTGTYTFSVKALATCSNKNINNCADSDTVTGGDFVISKSMEDDNGKYDKTYDGKAMTLTADSADDAQYQWLCNNKEISGATNKTYDATYVEQNGTYVCRITAGGNIYYSPNHVVNISPLAVTITASSDSKTYDGTALTNGTFTSATLADGDSAACTMTSASTITNVGSVNNTIGSVTIKDDTDKTVYTDGGTNNNYTVTKAVGTLTVSAKGIGDLNSYASDITVAAIADQTYTGSAITPVPVVKYGNDITLVNGTDYTLSYSANVNAGTVTVTITGKGNYSGSITKTFNIVQRKITVTSKDAGKTYDGTALTTSGTDKLTVTGAGLGSGDALHSVNFTGTQTDTGSSDNTFDTLTIYKGTENVTGNYDITPAYGKLTVTKKSLGDGEVYVADIADQTYTGAEIKPVPAVTYAPSGKTALTVSADDYDVAYSANVNKGTATITITAKGTSTNFSGTITKTFKIVPRAITVTSTNTNKTYDGTVLTTSGTGSLTVTTGSLGSGDALNSVTFTGTQTAAGSSSNTFEALTIYKGAENVTGNYTITPAYGTLTVSARSIEESGGYAKDITVAAIADQTYTGTAITPQPVVTCTGLKSAASTTLVKDTDYTLSYSANVNVGTVTVTITGKGNYSGSITKTFNIVKRAITVTSKDANKTYDGTTLTTSGTDKLTVTGAGLGSGDALHSVNFTGTQTAAGSSDNTFDTLTIYKGTENVTANYDITPAYGMLTVTKKSLGAGEVSVADIADQTYTGTEIEPVPAVTYAPSGKTALTVSPDDYDVTYSNNVNKGTATITITAKDTSTNFSGTITKTFKIVPKAITVKSTDASKTYDGTALTTSGVASLTVTTGELGSGDALHSVNFTGTQTAAGSSSNTFEALTIYKGAENVTGNYTITPAYGTLTVSAKSIEESGGYAKDITVAAIADQTYTGTAITPQPVVTCTGLKSATSTTLVNGTDYTLSYSANVNVGTVTITITGKGNYSGSITKTFNIVNADMTVTANDYSGTYDGSAHGISVSANAPASTATVYYGTAKIDSSNYLDTAVSSTVDPTYTNVGTYKVYYYITADNYDAADGNRTVTIDRKAIGDGSATPLTDITATADLNDKEYTGSAFTPAPAVNYSALPGTDKALKAGTDYTVSYADNTNTGTATMTITGQGNYSGSIVKTFKIVRKSIGSGTSEAASGMTVNMDLSDKTYSGSAFTPAAEVKYGETVLNEGTDYTVSYENNTDVGTATVTITGIGKYSGSIVKTFEIVKAGMTVTAENYSGTYDGKAHGISVSANAPASTAVVYYAASELTAANYSTSGSTANPTYTHAGIYTVYYYITADNYNAVKGSKTVTISRKAIGDGSATPLTDITATADLSDKSYTGSAFTPEPTVKFGNITLTSGTDYTVSYENNTSVGTATMTITGQGNYSGTIVRTFRIGKAKMTVSADGYSGIYDGKTHGISVSASAPASTAVIYYSTSELTAANYSTSGSTTNPGFTNAGTYTVYYCAAADDYDAVTGSRTVTISRRPIGNGSAAPAADITATADLSDRAYTGSAFTPAPTVSCSVLPGTDKTLKAGTDYTTAYEHNTNAGKATITITGKGNYSGTIVMTFNITAKSIGSGTAENYITVSDIADQVYQPAGCEPKPAVTCTGFAGGNKTLVEGKDYTLSYENNKAVGTATVTITGIGDFSGTITKTFRITAADEDYKVDDFTGVYDGSEHKGQVVKPSEDTVVYYSTKPLDENNYLQAGQSIPEFKNAGDYTIYYYVTRPNYNARRGSFKVKIDKMQPTISAEPGSFVYDGKTHRIEATTNGDGAVTYSNNDQIKAGSYTVGISTAETDNCYAAETTAELTITKRGLTLTADSGSRKYNGSALTADGYKISSGSLAGGDKITGVTISGSQVRAGTSDNIISKAVIRSSNGDDVTLCYDIVYVNGTLEVIKASSGSVYKRGGKGNADNGITAVSTNNDSRGTVSKSKDKTDNSGVKGGDTNNGTIKKNADNADSSSTMALFNILALVLLIMSALYSLLRRKNSMLNKILSVGIAVAGIILTILTFHAGTLVFVNKISIEFAILLAAAVIVTGAGMHNKNEE
ncbi:MAG: hypothetical protein LKJ83_07940, partial [Eubacteriaceae bacterium]|nr:hypothetical protein [Eubacteriaceae bacterium]